MRGGPAVGVDDDLAAGEAAVTLGPADFKRAGRVHQVLDLALDEFLGQHRLDDLLDHGLFDLLVRDPRAVLGREHHGFDRVRLAVLVADRDLRLGVRAQPVEAAIAADFRLPFHQAVREVDRHRHEAGRFVAGVAEHQALVAGALVEVEAAAFVHALCDVLRLLAVGDQHRAGVGIKADRGVGVADALDRLAGDLAVVDVLRAGRDFSGEDHEVVLDEGFRCDA